MSVLKFRTNINCKNCLRAVTPFLDDDSRIKRWEVNLDDPQKILTLEGEEITGNEVINILSKAGYKAQFLG
ncbi:MAG TPA: hypothetical protein PKH94_06080 [Bacteroidales bacterium]|nr:hypothetical protein [Bacteroidales bacterium]HNS46788.1 hypothetical protein [Bacteroidales bacterium]